MDQIAGAGSGPLGLGHDQRHLVADKAHHVRAGLVGAGAAQHRLVGSLQAVLVDRHVLGGEDGDDPRHGLGLDCINPQDAGVRASGEENFGVESVRHSKIGWVSGLPGDFGAGVHAGDGFTNCSGCHSLSLDCLVSSFSIEQVYPLLLKDASPSSA